VSSGFSAGRDGSVIAEFEAAEVSLLRSLVSMLLGLVSPGETSDDPLERALGIGSAEAPTDPVLARLFPSAYEDEKEASEFRRYTEATLRDGKRADAQTVLDTARSGRAELTPEQAQAWLRSLNDVRLTLGTKLDVTEEVHDEIAVMSEDDPRYPAYVTYDWLTYLQDSLVRALW
jgi:truncated hemoglobin YjbI